MLIAQLLCTDDAIELTERNISDESVDGCAVRRAIA
jgi:hypothetical protein